MATQTPYGMYLSFNNQREGFEFPILPEKLEITRKGSGSGHEVVGLGQINVIQPQELAAISFESKFEIPYEDELNKSGVLPPSYYIASIQSWMASGRPVRFTFTAGHMNINMAMSIEQFDYWEDANAPAEIQFGLAMKEYVFYAARKVKIIRDGDKDIAQEQPGGRADERVIPASYTLKPGDTLWSIARQQLGNGARWTELQRLNGIRDDELGRLQVGRVIQLPGR